MIQIEGIRSDMIANNLIPSSPIHPGEILKDEIESRGISQKMLANETGISYTIVNEVMNGKRQLTPEYALLIAKALDIDADDLMRIQIDYTKESIMRNNSFRAKLDKIRKIAASVTL
ncbi:MAG: HigA family addiction module antidote protein [Prevotella sp.]|jgi:addiction module HigA family antidote|nr:HigA family addiction module antidote protein [Prevotella sp.]MBQ8058217.1 HigA family addiction module antidote protein [Prevotella sp.]MBQ8114616.1 HigA family addiction module antidote protein [Prevotella sp.]